MKSAARSLTAVVFWVMLLASVSAAETPAVTNQFAPIMNTNATVTVTVRLLDEQGRLLPKVTTPKVVKSDEEWRKQLTPEQYQIARDKGTERAFCGAFYDAKKPGVYYCVCCGLPLFTSEAKFNSGTGWPSFFTPVAEENVHTHSDLSYGMRRTEILCTRCDCHLGHVFDDGPKPTGLRFCVNSASLVFKPDTHFKDATGAH